MMPTFSSSTCAHWRNHIVELFMLIVALGLVKSMNAMPTALTKRDDIKEYLSKVGIRLFSKIANSAEKLEGKICTTSAIIAVTGFVTTAFEACVGTIAVGAMASALAAGIQLYAEKNEWEWYKGSAEVGKRNDIVSFDIPKLNMTFFGGQLVTSDYYDIISTYLGEHTANVTFLAQAQTGSGNQITKRDKGDYFVTWTFDRGNFNTTVYARPDSVASAAAALSDHISNATTLHKRDDGEWVSFNTYGFNVVASNLWMIDEREQVDEFGPILGGWITSKVQSCTNSPECYAVESKFCLAMGASSTAGDNSIIVGEGYVQAYGGIDSECDGL